MSADLNEPAASVDEVVTRADTLDGDGDFDFSDVPWWRRPRRLRRQLAGTLVVVALASVALVGGLNFVAARQLLDDGTRDQLVGVGEARARSIDLGLDRVLGQVSAIAADLAVVESLESLDEAFRALGDEELSPDQDAALDAAYQEVFVDPLNELELDEDFTLDDVVPRTQAGRYAQFHYSLVADFDARRQVLDPGDGSDYSAVHPDHHPYFLTVASLGYGDLLLVNDRGDVVYSVEKRGDFGTNLRSGPYRDTNLADTLNRRLSRVPVGESVVADLELYLPGGAQPVIFVAASIRRDTEVIGALVAQVPVSALNAITTANGQWTDVGLATGESYVVGRDKTLVSESRLWLEDPDRYLDRVDDAQLESLIQAFGSPVGLQPVQTEPAGSALDGNVFEGVSENYLGQKTFSYATPITTSGVEWVVVADIPLSEARGPLYDYAKRLGLVLLIILPIAALVGLWLAGRLTRPIPPVVDAALAVAQGERNPDVPDRSRDEFGDLARRLKHMASELEQQETALAQEFEERRQLLLTVLPPRIVEADGVVSGTGDVAETATVVAVTVQAGVDGLVGDDSDLAAVLAGALDVAEAMAREDHIERIRAATDQYLFVAGLGSPGDQADEAIHFALRLADGIAAHAEETETSLGLHIGVSSGPVATGVLERGDLTFAAWGEPVRRALAIGALAQTDEVLVDATTVASSTEGRWPMLPATDVLALDGRPMELFTVISDRSQPSEEPV